MKRLLVLFALLMAAPALAQTPNGKQIVAPSGYLPAMAIYCDDGTNHAVLCSFAGGGGGGGGGDASAANQSTQITAEQLIRDRLGDVASPVTGSVNYRLSSILAAIGSPLQAGGSVGLTGTLPAFGTTPTFNLGTAPSLPIGTSALPTGAATASGVSAVVTALGSPYQAGGALPLPSGAATASGVAAVVTALGAPLQAGGTVTANLGTLNGAATATGVAAVVTALGSPFQAGGTVNTVIQATATDRGAVVGTTAVQLMAANSSRRGFSVQVQGAPDTTGATGCWISGSATATADYHSLYVPRGTFYETPPTHVGTGAISAICSGASFSIYAREF